MIYYNKNLEIIDCPYGFSKLDQLINLIDKKVVVMSLDEYQSFSKITNTVDLLFLYEWSGCASIPVNLPANAKIFYYDYTYLDVENTNIFYYPQWLFYVADIEFVNDISTDYMFSCASRNFNNGRPGKIYNYQQLKKKPYWDNILFTKFKSIEPFEFYALKEMRQDLDFKQIVEEFLIDYNSWQSMDSKGLDLITSMSLLDISVYKKSLFHIVAETYIHQSILSEKTFKVFASGQIPIMCGAKHAIKHLRELGFDMFDDIIDHSYDNIDNWQQRIESMHTSLDKLIMIDHKLLLEQTSDRRIKNQQHLKSTDLHKRLLNPIVKRLFR